jgi:hypothetical protein
MNREEALAAITTEAARLVGRSYTELAQMIGKPFTAEHGKYQVEVQAHWDDKPNGTLRLSFAVDDRGLRAFFPLTQSTLVEPGGTFTGHTE